MDTGVFFPQMLVIVWIIILILGRQHGYPAEIRGPESGDVTQW